MSKLGFDPAAPVAMHRPVYAPFDPSRPKYRPTEAEVKAELKQMMLTTVDWSNFIGGVYVAPETDPA